MKRIWTISALVLVVLAFTLWRFHTHRTPEYAFHVIEAIESRPDVDRSRSYMTPQGYKVVAYALDQHRRPSTSPKAQFEKPQIRGTTCFFPFTEANDAGYLVFQKSGVWQFDDVVMTSYKGRRIELSAAWAIDHPVLAALKLQGWGEALTNLIKGFLWGLSLGGG